ncbi:MAG: cytochrome ubiquinol oxidase subunit I [Candidatus Dormibacteraeota bacterium]|nr:cytochrome ubiquinol oxidase subunit I [Candidatus Dormibacteraeota bacterium]
MDALTLARWQFGIVTVYHFLFVPLTIGLVLLVAIMQTLHVRSHDPVYLRMTKFWGKLFLINFAMGVATGLVQEFQFGMNWSSYSRYVGDIFGAPLAIEGLLAFFLESTFLGLWIFGWERLPEKVHLTCIWLVAAGTQFSAFFILAANSWMQNPVGYHINAATGRAEMTDFFAILGNPILLVTYPHTVFGALMTGSLFVLGVSAYHLRKAEQRQLFQRSAVIALIAGFVASMGVIFSGHAQAQVMTQVQPMKMASAEALYQDQKGAEFSLFAIGTPDGKHLLLDVTVPHFLSVLATSTWNGQVRGIDNIQSEYQNRFGPGDYAPVIPVTYWTFRLMVAAGFLVAALTAWGLFLLRRGRLEASRRYLWLCIPAIGLPFFANSVGWIFTEMGRQPWVVFRLLKTANGVTPTAAAWMVATSLVTYALLYAALAIVDGYLMFKVARLELHGEADQAGGEDPLLEAVAY